MKTLVFAWPVPASIAFCHDVTTPLKTSLHNPRSKRERCINLLDFSHWIFQSIPPEALEPIRHQHRIAHRVLDVCDPTAGTAHYASHRD
jgi:hypothetical protein